MPALEYVLPDAQSGQQFLSSLLQGSRAAKRQQGFSFSRFTRQTADHFGVRTFISSHRKELITHHKQRTIFAADRRYLYERVPLARAIVNRLPLYAWLRPPRIRDPAIDAWIEQAWFDHDLGIAAAAARICQRRDGFGAILVNTMDEPSGPISASSEITGYQHISIDDITPGAKAVIRDEVGDTRLYPHGIAQLNLTVFDDNGTRKEDVTVDGSRIIIPKGDVESRDWYTTPVLDTPYDALWALEDILNSVTKHIEQGAPIVVKVDIENEYSRELTEEDEETIMEDMENLVMGSSDYVGPIRGISVRRMEGASDYPEIDSAVRTLASKIAVDSPFSVNEVLASSRGSEQVTPEDRNDFLTAVDHERWQTVYRVLRRVTWLGQLTKEVPRLRKLRQADVDWPYLRTLNPRERVFVDKSEAQLVSQMAKSGHVAPHRIAEKFPRNTAPYNPRLISPNVSVRSEMGQSGASMQDILDDAEAASVLEEKVTQLMEDRDEEQEMLK